MRERMKKMKKRVVCMLGLVLVLGLSGCGSTAQTPSDATGQTEVEPVADEADAEHL